MLGGVRSMNECLLVVVVVIVVVVVAVNLIFRAEAFEWGATELIGSLAKNHSHKVCSIRND